MITALRAECMKTKRRFLWLLPFCVVFFEFLWTITNSYLRKPEIAAEGCYTLLYQFPLYNTIFMPLTLAAMASRLCDAENKGNTYKLLCTMQQKKIIFDAKLLMGIFYVLIFTALEAGVIPLLANLLSRIPGRIFPGQPGIVFTAADPVPAHPQPADPPVYRTSGQPGGSFFRLFPYGKPCRPGALGLLHGWHDPVLCV